MVLLVSISYQVVPPLKLASKARAEVCAAAYFDGKSELGGVRVDTHFVVDGGHRATGVFNDVGVPLGVGDVDDRHYFLPLGLRFLAVLAAALKALAVGAPFEPGLRIFSPDPAAIRFRFACNVCVQAAFFRHGSGRR